MSAAVLTSSDQIRAARRRLRDLGCSFAPNAWARWLRRCGWRGGLDLGDRLKSWDVLRTIEFLRERVPSDQGVLDLGAYCSETLPALHRLGYTALAGLDLNPALGRMPFAESIDYRVADFLASPFADGAFAAITAISVIEHGYAPARLFPELARLLRPGGYFLASFDYWPEKIDTAGIDLFGMDWRIFSRAEVEEAVAVAARSGLAPVGPLVLDAGDDVIHWGGKRYTFAWLALRKHA
jgi:SAM-dependent methyltransferase